MDKKPHLFQLTYWEMNGWYYCNDVKNLSGKSSKWYTEMRMLNLSIEDYIALLLKYNAVGLKYYANTDCLIYHFNTEKDVKNFCSYINKKAKAANYYCR